MCGLQKNWALTFFKLLCIFVLSRISFCRFIFGCFVNPKQFYIFFFHVLFSSISYWQGLSLSTIPYWQGPYFCSSKVERGRDREGVCWRGNFPLASVGSLARGDNRKRAHGAHRRVELTARPTASAPTHGSRERASFPLFVRCIFQLLYAFCMHMYIP